MKELIFRAKIKLNKIQREEALKFGDKRKHATVCFTFGDLLKPNFSIRELVIPWLLKGNQPELLNSRGKS